MRLRSASLLAFGTAGIALTAARASGQGRTIDEGTFAITAAGTATETENFKIVRGDNGHITATGQLLSGTQQITTSLTTDSSGTPLKYDIAVREKGVQTLKIAVAALGRRLTAMSSNQRGDESMHEYPLPAGRSVMISDGLVHQLYFLSLGKRAGSVEVIAPRDARSAPWALIAKGLEPIIVAGRTLTATHYSFGDGATRQEFWVDGRGRVLKMEIPGRQLVATREEPPKQSSN